MSARRYVLGVLVSLCVAVGATLALGAAAFAARGHVFSRTFGGPCTSTPCGNGQFNDPQGVAINETTGDVYVVDQGDARVEWFSSTGVYEGQFDGSGKYEVEGKHEEGAVAPTGQIAITGRHTGEAPEVFSVAVDNDPASPSFGDVYVGDVGHGVIDKFSPTGAYINQLTPLDYKGESLEIEGVGVDPIGDLWIGLHDGANSYSNAEANELLSSVPVFSALGYNVSGFAVDSLDDLYITTQNDVVIKVGPNGYDNQEEKEFLNSAVDSEPASGLAVELSSNDIYVDNIGSLMRFAPDGTGIESLSLAGAHGSGVGVSSKEGELFVAQSGADDVEVFVTEPPAAPTVETETVSNVTGESAIFEAEINPRGASTEYHFEYGLCDTPTTCASSGYEASAPASEVFVGSGFEVSAVSPVLVQGLRPGAVYHYRVVAHNEHGVQEHLERVFSTQAAGPFELIDGREWEMVSPPQKNGVAIEALNQNKTIGGVLQAAAGGGAISYLADEATEQSTVGFANAQQILSTRGPNGWVTRDLALPHTSAVGQSVGYGQEYRFFSEDLSHALLNPWGAFVPLSQEASESTPYLGTDFAKTDPVSGDVSEPCLPTTTQCYRPLVVGCAAEVASCPTSVKEHADVPPGTIFGGANEGPGTANECPPDPMCGPRILDATADASHVVFGSEAPLTPEGQQGRGDLYEWSDGQISLVSKTPEGVATPGSLGDGGHRDLHAISSDGSRVFWQTEYASEHAIYMSYTSKNHDESIQLDGGLNAPGSSSIFQDASEDGSRAWFLRGDALYECEILVNAQGKPECKLSNLTSGSSPGVQGWVIGASGAGCDVSSGKECDLYFVANGVLAPGAVQGSCGQPQPTALCNLYVIRDGVTRLVAVVSQADNEDWTTGFFGEAAARVSPDGGWLAFMSDRELTGYDPRNVSSGKPVEEMYLYDAQSGKLACASCDPTGARPLGPEAATAPGYVELALDETRYQPRYLSDSGRLFFNDREGLVSKDVNGTWDVYEYEPEGVGREDASCGLASGSGSVAFEEAKTYESGGVHGEEPAGCVGLISSGNSPQESSFMDASQDGSDVFFLTTAKLAAQDFDDSYDVYDAHECTSGSPCPPPTSSQPPECTTAEGCRVAPTPQPTIFGAPSSATFSGAGNLTPTKPAVRKQKAKSLTRAQKLARALRTCAKDPKRKRARCEKRARAEFGRSRPVHGTPRGGR